MSHEKITDLMQQWLAAWNRADRAALERLAHETYTPDCVIHDAGLPNDIRGPEALMALL